MESAQSHSHKSAISGTDYSEHSRHIIKMAQSFGIQQKSDSQTCILLGPSDKLAIKLKLMIHLLEGMLFLIWGYISKTWTLPKYWILNWIPNVWQSRCFYLFLPQLLQCWSKNWLSGVQSSQRIALILPKAEYSQQSDNCTWVLAHPRTAR